MIAASRGKEGNVSRALRVVCDDEEDMEMRVMILAQRI